MIHFSFPSSQQPSLAYFCPSCGEVWAKVECGGKGWSCGRWSPYPLHCPQHPVEWEVGGEVPGSLLQPFLWWDTLFMTTPQTALRLLPDNWLRYEFTIHLAALEKELT